MLALNPFNDDTTLSASSLIRKVHYFINSREIPALDKAPPLTDVNKTLHRVYAARDLR